MATRPPLQPRNGGRRARVSPRRLAARREPGPVGGGLTVPPFSAETRRSRLESLDPELFDVTVVGGGITGAGVARDAALRGYRVLLFERADFASGTSSASSKLIHGGLRYLAHGHLGLVYEALSERRILRRIAPHLVRPLDFLFPVYEGDPHGLTRLRIGVSLYDLLSIVGSEKFHRSLTPADVLDLQPSLTPRGLQGGLVYYDCQVDDARLTLENLIDAHELGAWILSYARVDAVQSAGADRHRLAVTDVLTGRAHRVHSRVVVNATGPWCEELAPVEARPLVRPTKGIHLVFSAARLPLSQAVVLQSPEDGRIIFAIPWGTHSYVGTTESDDADPDRLVTTRADVQYLLRLLGRAFPSAVLTEADVVSTWAGSRPLVHSDVPATAASREHRIVEHAPGFLTVAGGKLTTYRRMAREIVDRAAARLGTVGPAASQERTDERPLPGARGFPPADGEADVAAHIATETGMSVDSARHLLDTYGSRSGTIVALVRREGDNATPIVPGLPYVRAEIVHALGHEMVVLPEDFVMRRTSLFHKADDGGRGALEEVLQRYDPSLSQSSIEQLEKAIDKARSVWR